MKKTFLLLAVSFCFISLNVSAEDAVMKCDMALDLLIIWLVVIWIVFNLIVSIIINHSKIMHMVCEHLKCQYLTDYRFYDAYSVLHNFSILVDTVVYTFLVAMISISFNVFEENGKKHVMRVVIFWIGIALLIWLYAKHSSHL